MTADPSLRLTTASQTLPHNHLSHVLSISFDHYGRRFATASYDRTVRVWDLNSDGVWMGSALEAGATNEWQAHRGAVWDVSWGHPEFGQVLATAGADHAVIIWEEREGGFKSLATPERNEQGFLDTINAHSASGGAAGEATSRWVNKATLTDARRAVKTVQFAPRHLGLRLASGSADGVVRIYEALDTMNLNHWKLDGVIEAEVEENSVDGEKLTDSGVDNSSSNECLGVTSLSWCTGRFEPATLVIGCSSGRVSIYRYMDGQRSWLEAIRLPNHATANGVPRGVLDVAWAPNVGRSYHLLASCGKDNRLKVHRIKRVRGDKGDSEESSSSLVYEGTEVLDQSQSWKCQWNVTGTVLASSSDGGVVRLWKIDLHGRWNCVSEIVGDSSSAENQ